MKVNAFWRSGSSIENVTSKSQITASIENIPLYKTGTYPISFQIRYNNKVTQATARVHVCANNLTCNSTKNGCVAKT